MPVFLTARGRVRETVCTSNLHQIGLAVGMYMQDHDGLYPYAVDPSDRAAPDKWNRFPSFANDIPKLGLLQDVLQPYSNSHHLFACPADTGFATVDFSNMPLDAFPTSFKKYHTSYYYRTELAATRMNEASMYLPSQVNVLFDGVGYWHGTVLPSYERYNVLFADGHVKSFSRLQMNAAWAVPLQS
jgi:general secretion pathway protein G